MALTLNVGSTSSTSLDVANLNFPNAESGNVTCTGILVKIFDGGNAWSHCARRGDPQRQVQVVSKANRIVLKVSVIGDNSGSGFGDLALKMTYRTEPIDSVVGTCGFGWIALRQHCVTVVEDVKLTWDQAELDCNERGGHLVSVGNSEAQKRVEELLFNR